MRQVVVVVALWALAGGAVGATAPVDSESEALERFSVWAAD